MAASSRGRACARSRAAAAALAYQWTLLSQWCGCSTLVSELLAATLGFRSAAGYMEFVLT